MRKPVVIALSGKKGSGKNSLSSSILKCFNIWQAARSHSVEVAAATGGSFLGGEGYDVGYIIEVAFADLIKEFCIKVLGLEEKQCYGTDEQKNTPTKYKWKNTPHSGRGLDNKGCIDGTMAGREVMQIFGTECVRNWFGNVWAEATLRKILAYRDSPTPGGRSPAVAIITDNRFPNEVEEVLDYPHGYVIRLTREPFKKDTHSSETALDGFNWKREKCYVLDNAELSKKEQAESIVPILKNIFRQEFSG